MHCSLRFRSRDTVTKEIAFQEHDTYMHHGVLGKDKRSRPSRVASNHATKDHNSTLCIPVGSASGHWMLLPLIHIPQALLPLCFHPHSDPTLLVSQGDVRPLAGRLVPQGSTPEPREGRLQWIEKRSNHSNL